MAPDSRRVSLDPGAVADAAAALRDANLEFSRQYTGKDGGPQPVHTLIEGAQHFTFDIARRRGMLAINALDTYAPTPELLGRALGIAEHPKLGTINGRVREKLQREPIEDYRIDFEDGYGHHASDEEDRQVAIVAQEITRGMRDRTLPDSIGIRVKPLTEETRERSVRTLDLLLTTLVDGSALPARWTVTVPKITVVPQVEYFVAVLRALERSLGLRDHALTFELMVEVPQAIIDRTGRSRVPLMIEAADGRLTSIAFGTNDYLSAVGVTPAQRDLRHRACDFAKQVLQVATAATRVHVTDGSTALLPTPVHRGSPRSLSKEERADNLAAVHAAWLRHYSDVSYSLAGGFYRGWDLQAGQLVSRFAALACFYIENAEAAGQRLHTMLTNSTNHEAAASIDEIGAGQGLLSFLLRGIRAGALVPSEVMALTGLVSEDFRRDSFAAVVRSRGESGREALARS